MLNGLSLDAVYPILLLYPPETPVPSLSFGNLRLASGVPSLPLGMLILMGFNMYRYSFHQVWRDRGKQIGGEFGKEFKINLKILGILFTIIDMKVYKER